MNVGIVGAGAIAEFLLQSLNQNQTSHMKVKSVLVRDLETYQTLEDQFDVRVCDQLETFLQSDIDMVIEAATVEAAQTLLPDIIPEKDVILISIGALADDTFHQQMSSLANTHGRTVHLPSGAIGGLDLLQNAQASGEVFSVGLTTRKPARTLKGQEALKEAAVIFNGKASEAIKQFPKNINVSIILSLAGIGVEQTDVIIIADPEVDNNTHTIDITGEFGTATFTVENNPLPDNPKTSHLAAMSILGTLQRLDKSVKIG